MLHTLMLNHLSTKLQMLIADFKLLTYVNKILSTFNSAFFLAAVRNLKLFAC